MRADNIEVDLFAAAGGQRAGHSGDYCQFNQMPGFQAFIECRRAGSFDANYPDFRPECLNGDADAANQSAAANGDHESMDIRQRLQDFQANGSLPGDDSGISKGMEVSQTITLSVAQGGAVGIVPQCALINDLCAPFGQLLGLVLRGAVRQIDFCGSLCQPAGVSYAQPMIAA